MPIEYNLLKNQQYDYILKHDQKNFPVVNIVHFSKDFDNIDYRCLYRLASEERKVKASRLLREKDSCRSLISGALLKFCLYQSGRDSDTEICYEDENGKPYLRNNPIYFNLSHSDNFVVCAIDIHEIGVDIERMRKINLGIAKRFFSVEENRILSKCGNQEEFLNLFYKIWVLKESYIKCIGKGLSLPLEIFSVIPSDSNIDLLLHNHELKKKYFKMYKVHPDYKCAVCCSHEQLPRNIDLVSIHEIIETLDGLTS